MIAMGAGKADPGLLDHMRHDMGYATPKVGVRAAAFVDGRVLLVREASDGSWALPGGWADVTDSPAEAVVREVFEESGFPSKGHQACGRLRLPQAQSASPSRFHLQFILHLRAHRRQGRPQHRDHRGSLFCARRSAAPVHRTHDRGTDSPHVPSCGRADFTDRFRLTCPRWAPCVSYGGRPGHAPARRHPAAPRRSPRSADPPRAPRSKPTRSPTARSRS